MQRPPPPMQPHPPAEPPTAQLQQEQQHYDELNVPSQEDTEPEVASVKEEQDDLEVVHNSESDFDGDVQQYDIADLVASSEEETAPSKRARVDPYLQP